MKSYRRNKPLGSPVDPRSKWPGEDRMREMRSERFRREQRSSGRMQDLERELDRTDRSPEDYNRREDARIEASGRREIDMDVREKVPVGVGGGRFGALRDITDHPRLRKKFWKEWKEEADREPTQPWAKERLKGDPNDPIVSEGLWKGVPRSRVPKPSEEDAPVEGMRRGRKGRTLGCGCGGGKGDLGGCSCLGGSPETDEAIRQAFVAAEDGDCKRVDKYLDKAEEAGARVSLHRRQLLQDCKVERGGLSGLRRGKKGRMAHQIGSTPPVHDEKATKRLAKATGAVLKAEKAVAAGKCREAIGALVSAAKLVSAADEHQASGSGVARKEVTALTNKVKRLQGQVGGICAVSPASGKKKSARKPLK